MSRRPHEHHPAHAPKADHVRGGLFRKFIAWVFGLALLAAFAVGALVMFTPQGKAALKKLLSREPARQEQSATPPEAPSPILNAPHPVANRDVPDSARNLPPATIPEPPPAANTASEAAIPPAPPAPFPLPREPFAQGQPRVAQLWNGVVLRTQLAPKPGPKTALELAALQGPVLQNRAYTLNLTVPKAHQSLPALLELNAELTGALPGLPALLAGARVSPIWEEIYRRKVNYQRENIARLDMLLSNHNFYDTETILELTAPGSGRKALFIQSEMDTLTDGSDGDRYPEIVGESPTFQPFTSYAWGKRSTRPNPFLAKVRAQIAEADKAGNKARLATLRTQANELRSRSFLVGWIDPFIALPIFSLKEGGSHGPRIGDLAVILYKNQAYPALVGDAGPNFKLGEASYLICQALNPGASANQRPESDLKVSYLVFPGTAKSPFGPPNPVDLRDRAAALLKELDPTSPVQMHLWPTPPEPVGYEEAVANAPFSRKELWPVTNPFQGAVSVLELAQMRSPLTQLPADQKDALGKATPKAH
jgi:hypothetical protein